MTEGEDLPQVAVGEQLGSSCGPRSHSASLRLTLALSPQDPS